MAYASLVSLEQTTDLVLNHDHYSVSVAEKEEIRSIREYVMVLTSFLEEFPDKASHLEAKIRDLADETEALIEDFMCKQNRLSWCIGLSRSQLLQQLRKSTEEIGAIVGQIVDDRAVGSSASAVSSTGVATTSQKNVVVGLDRDLITIKDRLCGISPKLQVIPIVGMGGIGKTTLARNSYEDPLIVDRFQIRAWVTVSQEYSAQKILSTLIDSMKFFVDEQVLGQKIDEHATVIYQTLKGRRYLIVMDDVWSTQVWDDLRNSFPDDGNGSRIMLTTRLSDVAAYPDPHSPLHVMRFIDDHQSWDLLQQKVGSFPSDLEDIGRKIAQRCAGLPLAVVLVAGVLSAVNKTRASWDEIAKNLNPAVELEVEAVLSLSYTHLPHHLRPCLLFIGGLPEDGIIPASRLVKLWVAESFLKRSDGCSQKSFEEVAEEYLEDLVKRNLVIVNGRKSDGKIKKCSLHDMVRDMCISKAHEEKFLRVMDEDVLPQGLMNERRIILSGEDDLYKIWDPTIRTILCFQLQKFHSWLAFWGRSRLLRVLHAVIRDGFREVPAQLFELFHLRYLALLGFRIIPSAISKLVNLQTLIIRPTSSLGLEIKRGDKRRESDFSLPLEVWRMRQLRHLIMCAAHVLPTPPDPDGAKLPLENLQTLVAVKNLACDENILQMIPNVKKLGLVYTGNEEYGLHHLKYLHRLEKLAVVGCRYFSWQGKNLNFPTKLKKLSLEGGGFPWEDMGIVGSLPNLQVLKLRNACHGDTWETSGEEFPQLVRLVIEDSYLRRWTIQSNSFPRLRLLALRSCGELREIPEDIGDIPTLELVQLHHCHHSLVMSAKRIKEDQETYGNYSLHVRAQATQPIPLYSELSLL